MVLSVTRTTTMSWKKAYFTSVSHTQNECSSVHIRRGKNVLEKHHFWGGSDSAKTTRQKVVLSDYVRYNEIYLQKVNLFVPVNFVCARWNQNIRAEKSFVHVWRHQNILSIRGFGRVWFREYVSTKIAFFRLCQTQFVSVLNTGKTFGQNVFFYLYQIQS